MALKRKEKLASLDALHAQTRASLKINVPSTQLYLFCDLSAMIQNDFIGQQIYNVHVYNHDPLVRLRVEEGFRPQTNLTDNPESVSQFTCFGVIRVA
jgi:hypothetical protein